MDPQKIIDTFVEHMLGEEYTTGDQFLQEIKAARRRLKIAELTWKLNAHEASKELWNELIDK